MEAPASARQAAPAQRSLGSNKPPAKKLTISLKKGPTIALLPAFSLCLCHLRQTTPCALSFPGSAQRPSMSPGVALCCERET